MESRLTDEADARAVVGDVVDVARFHGRRVTRAIARPIVGARFALLRQSSGE